MEENTTTELHVSEEQLQAISGGMNRPPLHPGGTADMVVDFLEGVPKGRIKKYSQIGELNDQKMMARGQSALHKIALETNFHAEAQKHLEAANRHSSLAKAYEEVIKEK